MRKYYNWKKLMESLKIKILSIKKIKSNRTLFEYYRLVYSFDPAIFIWTALHINITILGLVN